MTGWRKRTIMEMARESGFTDSSNPDLYDIMLVSDKSLEAFAELVRADEREACAMTAENTSVYDRYSPEDTIADAIRARGNHD